jgi:long-chain acyl-CoA synthetase
MTYWRLMSSCCHGTEEWNEALHDAMPCTGTLGRIESDADLSIRDHMKDMAIVGGSDVRTREVNEVLCAHPASKARDLSQAGLPATLRARRDTTPTGLVACVRHCA